MVLGLMTGVSYRAPTQNYILDLYPAAAAYSLRRLKSGFSGPLIRVRRSSDNTEQDIGLIGDTLDTASLLSFVGAGNNGFIRTWYDQSGNNYHLGQTTTTLQPRIVTSGAIEVIGSTPCINSYESSRLFYTQVGNIFSTADCSAYYAGVFDTSNIADGRLISVKASAQATDWNTSTSMIVLGQVSIGTSVQMYRQGGSRSNLTNALNSTAAIYAGTKNATRFQLYRNTTAGTSTTSTASTALAANEIYLFSSFNTGATEHVKARALSVILYNTDVTSNHTNIRDALNTMYTLY